MYRIKYLESILSVVNMTQNTLNVDVYSLWVIFIYLKQQYNIILNTLLNII